MAVELASAYVTLIPSAKGMQAAIASEMGGPAQAAGTAAGSTFGRNFAKAGAVAGAAAIGKGVFDFTSFERGLNEVFTLIPDAGAQTFAELESQTKNFAKEFGVLPDQVIPSLYDSLSAGVPPDNVFAFLEDANKFAKAGATDLGTAVDGLTSTMNAYGLGAEDTSRVSDALFTAVRLGKTTVDELSSSMFQVAPIAASVGVPIEQVSAAFATLTAQGTPTAQAATQMRGAIAELAKSGTKSSDAFRDAFGQTFQEFIAGGGTLQEAAAGMQVAADEAGVELIDLFGSVEGAQAFVGLAADADAANETLAAVNDGAGATQTAFEQMEQGIGPKIDKLKARFAVLSVELGTALAPAIETVAGVVLTVVEAFNRLPAPIQTGIVIFGTMAAAVGVFGGAAIKMIGTLKAVGSAFSLLAANPWVLIIIAAVALAFIIVKYWDEIVAALAAAWDWIAGVASSVWNGISAMLEAAGSLVKSYIDTFYVAPVQFLIGVFESLPGIASAAWNGVKAAVEAVVDAIVGAIDRIKSAASDALGPVGDLIGKANSLGGGILGAIPGFDTGGVVPGPRGAPRLVLAHGGETILPTHKPGYMSNLSPIASGAGTMTPIQINIGQVRDDADIRAIKRTVEKAAAGQGQTRDGGLNW